MFPLHTTSTSHLGVRRVLHLSLEYRNGTGLGPARSFFHDSDLIASLLAPSLRAGQCSPVTHVPAAAPASPPLSPCRSRNHAVILSRHPSGSAVCPWRRPRSGARGRLSGATRVHTLRCDPLQTEAAPVAACAQSLKGLSMRQFH